MSRQDDELEPLSPLLDRAQHTLEPAIVRVQKGIVEHHELTFLCGAVVRQCQAQSKVDLLLLSTGEHIDLLLFRVRQGNNGLRPELFSQFDPTEWPPSKLIGQTADLGSDRARQIAKCGF